MGLPALASGLLAVCTTPSYLLVAFIIYYAVSSVAAWRRLRHFPGPPLARFSYLWMMSNTRSGRPAETFTKLNRAMGPLVRIGPNELVTDSPDIIKRMNGARTAYIRSLWYEATRFNPHEDSMFTLRDGAAHDKLKAQCAGGYAGRENPSLEDSINQQIAGFVDLIRRKYVTAGSDVKPMDLGRAAQYFTLDVITKLAYGHEFGYLATDSDVFDYISTTELAVPYLQLLGEVPYLQKIFFSPIVLNTVGPKPTDKAGLGKLMGVAKEVTEKRYRPDAEDEQDMLGSFVRHGVTRAQAETEVLFQIAAGSDTTATVIRTTLLYTMTSPKVYNKLKKEIRSAISEGRISSPITVEEAQKMSYLQAVIYEGLRMNAPFTGHCSKQVPAEGDTIDGMFVPGGTVIVQNMWGTVRRTDIFGKDADLFRPERWIEADAATREKMRQTAEFAFGYGRWGCAGKNVAFMELNKIFVELLRVFDFEIINPGRPWHSVNHQLFMQSDFWVKITEAQDGAGSY